MHSLRRAALRSAVSASRTVSTQTRIAPFAARAAEFNAVRTASPLTARFFSQTVRKASEEKDLEEAQRKSEEDFEGQVAADARQDVEENIAQTEEDIQEAVQEVQPPSPPKSEHSAFVRNLVFELTEEHLTKAFAKYGNVSRAFIARDPRGMSKGYGFVSFDSAKELEDACANVNGSFWHGRRITCIPRNEEGTNRSTERRHHQREPKEPTSQLFVGNIPYETTDAELNRLFRKFDNVKDVRVAVDRTTGWPRGFAHVDFADVESAVEAKRKLEGATLGDRALRLDFADGFQKTRDDGARPNYRRDDTRDSSRHSNRRDYNRDSNRDSNRESEY